MMLFAYRGCEWVTGLAALVMLDSLWICSLLFAVLVIILSRQSGMSARTRYATLLVFLVSMCIVPVIMPYWVPRIKPLQSPLTLLAGLKVGNAPFASLAAGVAQALALMWVSGFVVVAVVHFAALVAVRRIRRNASPVVCEAEALLVANASHRAGLECCPQICRSTEVATPIVTGLMRPTVIIPVGMEQELTNEQYESLLIHELAHVVRRDTLINYMQAIVEVFFFFNPVVLWTSRRLREEREVCCDELVVGQCDRLVYLKALACLANRPSPRRWSVLSAADGHVLSRIRRLAGQFVPAVEHTVRAALVGVAAGSLGFMVVVPFAQVSLPSGVVVPLRTEANGMPLYKTTPPADADTGSGAEETPDAPGQGEDDLPTSVVQQPLKP